MSALVPAANAPSPFDAIRRIDAQGEHWMARDLQATMAYTRWEKFEVPLHRAMKAAENTGVDVTSNFHRSAKISATRSGVDYRLTRYAAYLVAMNGDPNKDEVARAQTYFAVKTREAEVAVPAQREVSRRELAQMVIEAEDRAEEAARQRAIEAEGRAVAEHKVAELVPAAHSWTTLAEAHGDFSVADAAKILANDPAIDMGRDRLYDLMGELGWTFRSGDKGRWQPYQREIERGRLRTRFRSYDHPTTGKRVTASPDIRLTVKAIQWLHTHLGGTGEVQFPAEQLTIPGGAA